MANETPIEIRALALIQSCNHPQGLTRLAHGIINAGIKACLANGWVKYAHRNGMGYAVTPAGKAELEKHYG
jgi:hypothetical protein